MAGDCNMRSREEQVASVAQRLVVPAEEEQLRLVLPMWGLPHRAASTLQGAAGPSSPAQGAHAHRQPA